MSMRKKVTIIIKTPESQQTILKAIATEGITANPSCTKEEGGVRFVTESTCVERIFILLNKLGISKKDIFTQEHFSTVIVRGV